MNWTREQTIVALYVYCLIPFNKANNSNTEIRKKAEIIGRSVNSVKMKVGNFGSLDPELRRRNIKGLRGTSRLDEQIWDEYNGKWNQLAIDAERIIAKCKGETFVESSVSILNEENLHSGILPNAHDSEIDNVLRNLREGVEKERLVKVRVNQQFFRKMILSSYENRCCITGMTDARLLDACHIVDWAENESERMNPCNGLCMSLTFHRAYDKNLIGITPDYTLCISDELLQAYDQELPNGTKPAFDCLTSLNGRTIFLPNRFLPNRDFLAMHYEKFTSR